jgi:hypothetical protein
MRVDEDGDHAPCLVGLDESHAAHVAGEVVDVLDAVDGVAASVERPKIGNAVVRVREHLVPLVERFQIDGPNLREPVLAEVANQPTADESPRTRDEDGVGSVDRRHRQSSSVVQATPVSCG